jgi:O-antigen biosynthesis protein
MNKYHISVITGIGSVDKYYDSIEGYFENIQDQTMFKWTEHIIVYKEWSDVFKKYKHLQNIVWLQEDASGVYNAWNQCIKASTTELITNWNVDDRRFPKTNEKKYIALRKNKDCGLVYGWWIFTDKENEDVKNLSDMTKLFQSTPPDHHMWEWSCACGPSPMWRKELHDKVGYFNQEEFPSCADWDMWMAFNKITKIYHIKEYLSVFFINPIGVGQQDKKERNLQDVKILEKYNVSIPTEYKEKWYEGK